MIAAGIAIHENFRAGEFDIRVKAFAEPDIPGTIQSKPDFAVSTDFTQRVGEKTFGYFVLKVFRGTFNAFEFKPLAQIIPEEFWNCRQAPVCYFRVLEPLFDLIDGVLFNESHDIPAEFFFQFFDQGCQLFRIVRFHSNALFHKFFLAIIRCGFGLFRSTGDA